MASISFRPPALPVAHGRSSSGFSLQAHRCRSSVAAQLERCCFWTSQSRRQHLLSKRPLAAKLKGSDNPNSDSDSVEPSPLSDMILKLYSSLNDKDTKTLKKLIAHDCIIEDLTFFKPLEGEALHKFFERLIDAIGENVRFVIDKMCEGKGSTVSVIWHLEWNGKFIPFTKGCSFHTCSEESEALLIKEAHVFTESPLKPASLALEMLKKIIWLFDKFPNLAECFLQQHDTMLYYIMKFFQYFVGPFIFPLVMYYINIYFLFYFLCFIFIFFIFFSYFLQYHQLEIRRWNSNYFDQYAEECFLTCLLCMDCPMVPRMSAADRLRSSCECCIPLLFLRET
ncbi:uncharacterized protein [Typha angustifolia]|uniref:uncharacterized protein isoform X2 n=1 Tax=Typha angustifolia TaxID=59011 RepID=UPI003C30E09C